jgi:hypothetical protein
LNGFPIGVSFVKTASCTAPVGKATAQPVGHNSKRYVVGPTGEPRRITRRPRGHNRQALAGARPPGIERCQGAPLGARRYGCLRREAERPGGLGRGHKFVSSAFALPRLITGRGRGGRTPIVIAGSLAGAALLALVLAGRRDEFATALSSAPLLILGISVLFQIVALLSRSEAWHLSIEAAGGTVARRVLFRASSVGVLGSVVNAQLGAAARITALRRSSPEVTPQVPTLIAAEFPILAVEATLAALTSFTLVGPLGLPWWLPIILVAVVGAASAGLRQLGLRKGRKLWSGLLVLRQLNHGSRLVAFVLLAVFAQIFRNWMLLHAVGVDASFFDAIAVLIAVVTLSQLPLGPSVGAGAAVLILGHDGVAAAAAAGVLMTATGTAGGLCFVAWGGADRLWAGSRGRARPGLSHEPV